MVNQLLNIHAGARLPLLSAAREERLLGVKRVPQRDFGIPRFTYDEGLAQMASRRLADADPWVSEIRLALRYRSNDSLLRHFKDTSTLYLEIVDYPGEWLLDLPMLAQDYLSWSRQMTGLLQGQRGSGCPLAAAVRWARSTGARRRNPAGGDRRRRPISACLQARGVALYSAGAFCATGDMAGAPALQFFPAGCRCGWRSQLAQADKHQCRNAARALQILLRESGERLL